MRLILIRHPKPLCENGICYGRLDLECEPHALSEAVLRLGKLTSASPIFTSPARRARNLAAQLSTQTIVDERLQELDFGDWEGRRWQDLGRAAIDAWYEGLPDAAPPNGETLTAMAERCASWLKSIQSSESPVLAVTHAGPIRVIKAMLKGEPLLTYFTTAIPFGETIMMELPREMSELATPLSWPGLTRPSS